MDQIDEVRRQQDNLDPRQPEHLRAVMGHFCTGVVAITAAVEQVPVGFVCQSFSSLSLNPPLVVIAPARTSTSFPRIRAVGRFCANVLSEDQESVARALARSGGDKFSGLEWSLGHGGCPILAGSVAWAQCEIVEEHDAGDHTLVVARVEEMDHVHEAAPLTFYRGRFGALAPEAPSATAGGVSAQQPTPRRPF